jgi:hypothetical protein
MLCTIVKLEFYEFEDVDESRKSGLREFKYALDELKEFMSY